ncbi:polysaccharide deacetylase family protein [Natrarchaeobaculum aegyptiacum]|uniref:polysaccharide deacetylase family protein n=1 Tax=Natrarchaeobaculum aegyptiacum TaxID=745377 RepID=UPI001E3196E4|nr:polysaccharide deacetylase family protein [Natrarchaeobaculum aegyptiacum]
MARIVERSSGPQSISHGGETVTPPALESAPRLEALPADAEFALCLTHDVDRPYKGLRGLFFATRERPGYHLRTVLSGENPYWQFENVMALEDDLGVRSSWYVLNEQHLLLDRPPRDWTAPANWIQHLGRYDVTSDEIAGVLRALEEGGWEVGLHGSFHTADDPARIREETATLESVLDGPVTGGRQHHLRLSPPETWHYYRLAGLAYDASLGSTTECGFHHGYHPIRPFDDEFVVFPLTIMDQALPDPARRPNAARRTCNRLLEEAAANDAVMSVLWHPRYFSEREFPGHRDLYRWVIERGQELGAWIGSPRNYLEAVDADCVPGDESARAPASDPTGGASLATDREPSATAGSDPTTGGGQPASTDGGLERASDERAGSDVANGVSDRRGAR